MFYMWNVQEVDDPMPFNAKVKELLSGLSTKASSNPKFYATGELELSSSETLYALTQCTWDLSSSNCKKCLDNAISELPNCCDAKRGGRVVGGSCNFRYELYPIVDP
ncbi:hypothetical protein PRUPE_3G110200 [Prunus persica]|uniref:Gnk2-homologous domain-containing protein n=1 Tax=Prunus persica TaxID=3760 RepID=A0A251PYH0_PRUPE|nr:hypothetical protein PRUPE_3G110200 [Prunus persica]